MKIVRGECGCVGVALDKPATTTDGTTWHHILVLYSCMGDGRLGFEQAVRSPGEVPVLDAVALVTQVAKAADRGGRALSALKELQSELAWAKDASQWGR